MEELNHLYYSKKSDNEKVRKIQMALEKGSSILSLYEMEIEKDSVDKILLFLGEKENHLYDDDDMDINEWCYQDDVKYFVVADVPGRLRDAENIFMWERNYRVGRR